MGFRHRIAALVACLASLPATTAAADISGLPWAGCYARDKAACQTVPVDSFHAQAGIAVSPDGQDVYVAQYQGASHFRRNVLTGALTFAECYSESQSGCLDIGTTQTRLDSPARIAVSPDGADVYVAGDGGTGGDAAAGTFLLQMRRSSLDGSLSFAGCFAQLTPAGSDCGVLPTLVTTWGGNNYSRTYAGDVALNPAGTALFLATTWYEGTVSAWVRDPSTGGLTFDECLDTSSSTQVGSTCEVASEPYSTDHGSLAVSPDGLDIYSAAQNLVHLSYVDGDLAYENCVGATGNGCSAADGGLTLDGRAFQRTSLAVALSPDGAQLYAGTKAEDGGRTVVHLHRQTAAGATRGDLSFGNCLTPSAGDANCTQPALAYGFESVFDLALTPDATSLYASAQRLGGDSASPDGFMRLSVDQSNGATAGDIALTDCISDVSPCAQPPASELLRGAGMLAIAPDGDHVYGAGGKYPSHTLVHFGPNTRPACQDAQTEIARNHPASLTLDCTDANLDTMTRSVVDPPDHGSLGDINQSTGAVSYTPDTGFNGTDTFTFRASDAGGDGALATYTITVTNQAPTCTGTSRTVSHRATVSVTLGPCTDADGDPLTLAISTQPGHGTLSALNVDQVTYDPSDAYAGADSFKFRAFDGAAQSAEATVAITVADAAPSCAPPSPTVVHDRALAVNLGCSDGDADPLGFPVTDAPDHGTLSAISGAGATSYTPAAGYTGPDAFTVGVTDGAASVPVTVSLTVVNTAPICAAAAESVAHGTQVTVPLSCSDADGDALTLAIATQPAHGTLGAIATATGTVGFTAASDYVGEDAFTFTAGDGIATSAAATAALTITGRAPACQSLTVPVTSALGTAIELACSDPDGDPVTRTLLTQPAKGTLSAIDATGTVIYTPPAGGPKGEQTFTYGATAFDGASAPATVTLDVAVMPPAAPAPTPVALEQIAVLPSAKKACVSRRKFPIRLRNVKRNRIVEAEIKLNGKAVRKVKGRALALPIDLRGLPKGPFLVEVMTTNADGKRVIGKRRYRTCTPKRRRST